MHHITTTLEGMLTSAELIAVGMPLVLLGALAAFLAGARNRLLILAVAVPSAVGLLVVTAQVLGSLGAGPPLAAVAVLSLLPALAWGQLARRLIGPRRATLRAERAPETPWPVWAGASLGAVLGLAAWLPGIADPALPGQNIDDVWHGYLARRIGDMDAVTAGAMSPVFADRPEPTTFYPYGLHLAAAVLRALTGAEIPVALNALWAVAVGVMLPFGVAALLRVLLPARPWAAAYAAVTASAVNFFPYALSGLQPYALSLSMIPGLLALVALVARPVTGELPVVPGFLLVAGSVGVLVAHPAGGATFAVVAALVAVEAASAHGVAGTWRAALRLLPVGVAAALLIQPFLRSAGGALAGLGRSADTPLPDAMTALRMLSVLKTPWTPSAQSVIGAAVVVGLLSCLGWRRRCWSLVAGYALFFALFAGVSSGASWPYPVVGAWYGDWYRLAAAAVLLATPLAGIGADTLHDLLGRFMSRPQRSRRRPATIAGAVVASVLALVSMRAVAHGVLSAQSSVQGARQQTFITADDVALFREVGSRVGPGELVLNNWYDGSPWMYGYGDARPAVPYHFSASADWSGLLARLPDLQPADCRLMLDRHVTLVAAKELTYEKAPNPLLAGALAKPTLFPQEFVGKSGRVFGVDRTALRACAKGEG